MFHIRKQDAMKQAAYKIISIVLLALTCSTSAFCDEEITIAVNGNDIYESAAEIDYTDITNPAVIQVSKYDTNRLLIKGKKAGKSKITINDTEEVLVHVTQEDTNKIKQSISDLFPTEQIDVHSMDDKLIISGYAKHPITAKKIIDTTNQLTSNGSEVLNLIETAPGHQVMLQVKIGEVRKGTLESLGSGLGMHDNTGKLHWNMAVGAPTTTNNSLNSLAMTYNSLSSGIISIMLNTLENKGLFKVLAEPNLIAMSGEPATFHAGSEIGVQVSQNGSNTIEYKPVGVALKFTPYTLANNRIRIHVEPEVSELEEAVAGKPIRINTRKASTTVELSAGESFMIAGLIKNEARIKLNQIPGASRIPIIGALARSSSYEVEETELVISITPYIVDPLSPNQPIHLPNDEYTEPSILQTLLMGSLGGSADGAHTLITEGRYGYMME